MAKWIVRFKDVKKEAEVEAEDRWEAVVKAVEKLGLPKTVSLSYYAGAASVTKVDRKKKKAWWEK